LRSASSSSGGAARVSSNHEGTTMICARRSISSPCATWIAKPALVRSAPGVAAQTESAKRWLRSSSRSSPKTRQGTDRWKGLMPSKATTATVSGCRAIMARFYRWLAFGPLSAKRAAA